MQLLQYPHQKAGARAHPHFATGFGGSRAKGDTSHDESPSQYIRGYDKNMWTFLDYLIETAILAFIPLCFLVLILDTWRPENGQS